MNKLYTLAIMGLLACGGATHEKEPKQTDSIPDSPTALIKNPNDFFEGEYMVGDGVWFVYRNANGYEMKSSPDSEPIVLEFQGIEDDTVSVYATDWRSVRFKMHPGHDKGMYYEDDEQWPVQRTRIFQTDELAVYTGEYTLVTESEGATGKLILTYKGDRVFAFELSLDVAEVCNGLISSEFIVDRSQHGFYSETTCPLHFNFTGFDDNLGFEIEVDQPESCSALGEDCIFSGTYVSRAGE